jgi:hypothetical protein
MYAFCRSAVETLDEEVLDILNLAYLRPDRHQANLGCKTHAEGFAEDKLVKSLNCRLENVGTGLS